MQYKFLTVWFRPAYLVHHDTVYVTHGDNLSGLVQSMLSTMAVTMERGEARPGPWGGTLQ